MRGWPGATKRRWGIDRYRQLQRFREQAIPFPSALKGEIHNSILKIREMRNGREKIKDRFVSTIHRRCSRPSAGPGNADSSKAVTQGEPSESLQISCQSDARGSSGFNLASSRRISFDRSSRGMGTVNLISTISSPRLPSLVAEGTPFSRRRSFCPD